MPVVSHQMEVRKSRIVHRRFLSLRSRPAQMVANKLMQLSHSLQKDLPVSKMKPQIRPQNSRALSSRAHLPTRDSQRSMQDRDQTHKPLLSRWAPLSCSRSKAQTSPKPRAQKSVPCSNQATLGPTQPSQAPSSLQICAQSIATSSL